MFFIKKKSFTNIIHKKIILPTEFGRLVVLNPLLNSTQKKTEKTIITERDITYIDNNTTVIPIYKSINRTKSYYLFKPDSHLYNATINFTSIKKKLNEQYYGNSKSNKNPFESCTSIKDIFNLSRNIKMSIKKELSRFGIKVFRTGEIDINTNNDSFIRNNLVLNGFFIENFNKFEREFEKNNSKVNDSLVEDIKFTKYDYFVSMNILDGILISLKYNQKGFSVNCLGNKKIFPLPGVFNPTRDDYLDLFNEYLRSNIKDYKQIQAIDVGCGSGVLSFIMAENGVGRITSIDNNINAVTSCQSNANTMGYYDVIKASQISIGNDKEEERFLSEMKSKFDLFVINPPWLNASFVFSQNDFENSIYDPSHQFLKASFKFSKKILSNKGRIIVIFSNLGEILQINEKDIVEKIAFDNNYVLHEKVIKDSQFKISNNYDPLKNFKKSSKIVLYEFRKAL